jgi:hypothetical protein
MAGRGFYAWLIFTSLLNPYLPFPEEGIALSPAFILSFRKASIERYAYSRIDPSFLMMTNYFILALQSYPTHSHQDIFGIKNV